MSLFTERKTKVYQFICDPVYVPMKIRELAIVLQVKKEDRAQLEQILQELVAEGKVDLSKRGKYTKAEKKILQGTFCSTRHAYGFIIVEGEEEDYFVSGHDTMGAMDRDEVAFEIVKAASGRRKEARVIEIVQHGITEVVGTFEQSRTYGFVISDNPKFEKDIFIPLEKMADAMNGQKVLVHITEYGDERRSPEGEIVEVIGFPEETGTDVMCVAKAYGLPIEFPTRVLNQAERVAVPVSDQDIAWRKDLREVDMVTIDGDDSKDLDDAVSLVREGENYILGVHIADVTNYVQEKSALDQEARFRGTSVYFVDRVIPMLPVELSNGICSLNAGEDRLAMSCIMTISPKGEILAHEICESVIRVNERMTYRVVNTILTDPTSEVGTGLCARYASYVSMFQDMAELSGILRKRRMERGSIDFDFPESQVLLDESGKPVAIVPHARNIATKLIEDFMLAANETVAEDFFWRGIPFVYRTHEKPDPDKIKELQVLVSNFGYGMKLGKKEIHPKELQKLLERIEGTPYEALISRLTLRSLQQAKYTPECTGHFGLAARYYCHFTSPIRRYPDLQIHRIMKEVLRGNYTQERIDHYKAILPTVCQECSTKERRADEVERETVKMKKAEYMLDHIGETFCGVISGLTGWGIYVELENTVEGMIRLGDLTDDYYTYDESRYEVRGERTGRTYRLGQEMEIQVVGADKQMRIIDFLPAEMELSLEKEEPKKPRRPKKRKLTPKKPRDHRKKKASGGKGGKDHGRKARQSQAGGK